jgi:DNA-directed RNA polymerase specialized sigma24 family protein
MTPTTAVTNEFTAFVAAAEPRLRMALGSAYGFELAEEATAEAMAFAWEHWDRVASTDNPVGYIYAVGRNKIRKSRRRGVPTLPRVVAAELPWVEPGLPGALQELSERQRQVVMLLHCFDWTLGEVAGLLGMSKGTVQVHERRGLTRLRRELGCDDA